MRTQRSAGPLLAALFVAGCSSDGLPLAPGADVGRTPVARPADIGGVEPLRPGDAVTSDAPDDPPDTAADVLVDAGPADTYEPLEPWTPPIGPIVAPEDAVVAAGACLDAPVLDVPGQVYWGTPDGGSAYPFAAYRVAPGQAVGVHHVGTLQPEGIVPGAQPVSACISCDAFSKSGASCTLPGPDPQRFYRDEYTSTGNTLVINGTGAPLDIPHSSQWLNTVFERVEFDVAEPPTPEQCASGWVIPAGVAAPHVADCPRSFVVPPGKRALVFGVHAELPERWVNTSDQPRNYVVEEETPFAWLERDTPANLACDSAEALIPGEMVVVRTDLTSERPAVCAWQDLARGARYYRVAIPAGARAVLHARSVVVADGGGGPLLLMGGGCSADAPCEQVLDGTFQVGYRELSVENAGEAPVEKYLAVMQGGIGYEGNAVLLELELQGL